MNQSESEQFSWFHMEHKLKQVPADLIENTSQFMKAKTMSCKSVNGQ